MAEAQTTSSEPPKERQFISTVKSGEVTGRKPPTGYITSVIHLAKGYVGTGIFAMGEGFKNSGLVAGPVSLLILAFINLNCQRILIRCVEKIASEEKEDVKPSFAETVEYTMEISSSQTLKRMSKQLGWLTNIFLCVSELGFCCVYFVFIAAHLENIATEHGWLEKGLASNKHIMLAIILVPMWASTFLGNFRLLMPLSLLANVLMWCGILIIVYFTLYGGLPSTSERKLISSIYRFPLFFGTALYAFEGITFIIPLRNEMSKPESFISPLGVLNVGMVFVCMLYLLVGTLAYWKYGDNVASSVFLNFSSSVPGLTDAIDAMMSIAVLFTFTLHMYVPFEITYPLFYRRYGPFKHSILAMCIYRSIPVLMTYFFANVIPFLGLFISLIGASGGAFLALILPPALQMIAFKGELKMIIIVKDFFIIMVGVIGAITGTFLSVYNIVVKFDEEYGNSTNKTA